MTNLFISLGLIVFAVTVSLPVVYDYIDWVPARVVLRKGRAVRTFKAFVMPQCDAL